VTIVSISSAENLGWHEHIGDELFTFNKYRERRGPRLDYPPFSHCSKEEEEAQWEAKRMA
jgi:hypothetical protein